jgi:putative ABC transport system substrate-binding protein
MDRRLFITIVSKSILAGPLVVAAQQTGKVYRVGFLTGPIGTGTTFFDALRQGLQELSWKEGQDIAFDHRVSDSEHILTLATELVRSRLDVIVLTATSIRGARQATATVPVEFVIADDSVAASYVRSLARPGGNMTGLTSLNVDLDAKRLEILKMALPSVARVVLSTPLDPTSRDRIAVAEHGARSLGLQLEIFEVPSPDELPGAVDRASRARVGAVMVLGSPLLLTHQARIVKLGATARLPVISAWKEFPNAGGLISYGTSLRCSVAPPCTLTAFSKAPNRPTFPSSRPRHLSWSST